MMSEKGVTLVRVTVLLKLSFGILKESLLHPSASLILDKETGKVSRVQNTPSTAPRDTPTG